MKQERLEDLLENQLYTERYMLFVGRRCRESNIRAIAKEQKLDWKTVKDLEKRYMEEQLKRAPEAAPRILGIDEISVKKGRKYKIVVSDLERRCPIWFGGDDRSEASLDQFYEWLGEDKSKKIKLVVIDMWKAFKKSTNKNAPQADILFDKFHVINHLNDALDTVRKGEYKRLSGEDRSYIKGKKYTLLSRKKNLDLNGRKALRELLSVNQRLNKAYLLKESFVQLWSYKNEGWARRFFDNWKESLKWQRLKPYEKFAAMVERNWSGVVAFCRMEHKIPLGFVEGLNNKIRVFQRRAYGLRDEEYLRLKVLTCMLPEI